MSARIKITPTAEVRPEPLTAAQRGRLLWLAVIAIAVGAAYAGSLQGPFIFDDVGSITDNASIHHLATALVPPHDSGQTVEARPLLNLSLAVNYLFGGLEVRGYHLVNVVIHGLAALVLFELLRLAFALPSLRKRFSREAETIAGVSALLWAVHPLQTESITYVIQRAESLTGLFFLGSFYCLVRSASDARGGLWRALCVTCVFLGIATKEIMATAIPLLLLFESTFLASSPSQIWKRHRGYCIGLIASVAFLGALLASSGGNRSGSIGFGIGISPGKYLLTQPEAIVTYLKLSVFPYPLILDYGAQWVRDPLATAPFVLLTALLLAASVVAVLRFPRTGYAAAWFWLILAPTSSIIPGNRQTIAEHRMYLPLAAVIVGLVVIASRLIPKKALIGAGLSLAVAFAMLTALRNKDYASPITIYGDNAKHRPENPYAHNNYGFALGGAGRTDEAQAEFSRALDLWPTFAEAHFNLGFILSQSGHNPEALAQYRQAIANKPHYVEANLNLGLLLTENKDPAGAIAPLHEAVDRRPTYRPARIALGNALAALNRLPEAKEQFAEVIRQDPDDPEANYDLGMILIRQGSLGDGAAQAEKGLALQPDFAEGQHNLAVILAQAGNLPRALPHFEAAVRSKPAWPEAQLDYGSALAFGGQPGPAATHYLEAIRLRPGYAEAYFNLGNLAARGGRMSEAIEAYTTALRYRPDYPEARQALAYAQQAPTQGP